MEEGHTRAVQIVTWCTVITSIVIVVTGLVIRATVDRSISLYEYLISAALVRIVLNLFSTSSHSFHLAISHRAIRCSHYANLPWIRQAIGCAKQNRSGDKSKGILTSTTVILVFLPSNVFFHSPNTSRHSFTSLPFSSPNPQYWH